MEEWELRQEYIYIDRKVTSRVHHESENSHDLAYSRGPLSSTSKQCRKFPDYPASIAIVKDEMGWWRKSYRQMNQDASLFHSSSGPLLL